MYAASLFGSWLKLQGLPLILNGKSTDIALFCLYEEISFICVTYLFDLGVCFNIFTFTLYLHFVI